MKPDLDRRAHIHDAVVIFYREVVFDDLLGPVFDEVAQTDWATHIPKLIDFWCRMVLGEPGYDGFVLGAHQRVDALEPLRQEHFDRWYSLWVDTIDGRWEGPGADLAKDRARRIMHALARNLAGTDWSPPEAALAG